MKLKIIIDKSFFTEQTLAYYQQVVAKKIKSEPDVLTCLVGQAICSKLIDPNCFGKLTKRDDNEIGRSDSYKILDDLPADITIEAVEAALKKNNIDEEMQHIFFSILLQGNSGDRVGIAFGIGSLVTTILFGSTEGLPINLNIGSLGVDIHNSDAGKLQFNKDGSISLKISNDIKVKTYKGVEIICGKSEATITFHQNKQVSFSDIVITLDDSDILPLETYRQHLSTKPGDKLKNANMTIQAQTEELANIDGASTDKTVVFHLTPSEPPEQTPAEYKELKSMLSQQLLDYLGSSISDRPVLIPSNGNLTPRRIRELTNEAVNKFLNSQKKTEGDIQFILDLFVSISAARVLFNNINYFELAKKVHSAIKTLPLNDKQRLTLEQSSQELRKHALELIDNIASSKDKVDFHKKWKNFKSISSAHALLQQLQSVGLSVDSAIIHKAENVMIKLSKQLAANVEIKKDATHEEYENCLKLCKQIASRVKEMKDVTFAGKDNVCGNLVMAITNIFVDVANKAQAANISLITPNVDQCSVTVKELSQLRNSSVVFPQIGTDDKNYHKILVAIKKSGMRLIDAINACALPGENPCFTKDIGYILIYAVKDKAFKKDLIELLQGGGAEVPAMFRDSTYHKKCAAQNLIKEALKWRDGRFACIHGSHPGTFIADNILKDKEILNTLSGKQIIDIAEGHPNLLREMLQHTYWVGLSRKKVSDKIDETLVTRLLSSKNLDDVADILFKKYTDKITPVVLAQAILNGNDETRRLILANPKLLEKVFQIPYEAVFEVEEDRRVSTVVPVKNLKYGMKEIIRTHHDFLLQAMRLSSDKKVEIPGLNLANEIIAAEKTFNAKGGRATSKQLEQLRMVTEQLTVEAANILAGIMLNDKSKRAIILSDPALCKQIRLKAHTDIIYSTAFISMTVGRTYNLSDAEDLIDYLSELEKKAKNKNYIDTFCKYNPEIMQKLMIPRRSETTMVAATKHDQNLDAIIAANDQVAETVGYVKRAAVSLLHEKNGKLIDEHAQSNESDEAKKKELPLRSSFKFYKENISRVAVITSTSNEPLFRTVKV